jgi:hypothetical protein
MGTDITGWVEVKRNEHWFGVIKINALVKRNYQMFDFLFSGRSDDYLAALASKRGIPDDCSPEVQTHIGYGEGHSGTWIGWQEIQAVDWSKHDSILTDDWRCLFEMMRLLANQDFINDVRLVVDFF